MKNSLRAEEIITLLNLSPLPGEGGYFHQTFLAPESVTLANGTRRQSLSAIYYLITPDSFSSLHVLPSPETFHFYLGDSVEMVQLSPAGELREYVLGSDLRAGEHPQVTVPAGYWQGSRLRPGGQWALLGTNVGPGFEFADLRVATVGDLGFVRDATARDRLAPFLARA